MIGPSSLPFLPSPWGSLPASGPGPEAGGEPKGDGKKGTDEGPIIDAEVVDDKK